MALTATELSIASADIEGRVIRAFGSEAMNALSRWEIEVACADASADLHALLGRPLALTIVDPLEQEQRTIDLIVIEAAYLGEWREGHHVQLVLAPQEWHLTLRHGHRVFLDLTTKEIVAKVLEGAGIPPANQTYRLTGHSNKRLQCVQYDETEWSFVERLLADEGIAYWFEHDDSIGPRVVFGDDPGAHEGIAGSTLLPFTEDTGMRMARHARMLECTSTLATNATHVRDYDERTPDLLVEGKAGEGVFEWYEYPACVLDDAAAKARAQVRLEQLQRSKEAARSETDCIRIQPGRLVELDGAEDAWMNRKYLVVAVEHHFARVRGEEEQAVEYFNDVRLVPYGAATFRPLPPRAVPRVAGIETAMTTGPAGEEIHVDDLGALKIRFPWDRSGIADDKSSDWARCMQLSMGGSMLIPRVGWEVPIVYVDGNPDRPIVVGRMYNATAVLPYSLPGASASTSFQSATSPGGGSTNEIRMGDSGGSQEFFVHASKDQTVTVGGSADTSVSVDATHDVGLGLSVAIKASQSTTVGASQKINVTGDISIGIKGSRSESVGGMETNKITANRIVDVGGAYMELVGALYGVQCNQSNYTVRGAFTQLIGAAHSTTAGLGFTENVAAARTELVGGARTITAGRGANESVRGVKSVTAGPTTEKAGGKVLTEVKAAGSIKAASITIDASGDVDITAPSISIDAGGGVTAMALKLKGGFKVTDGSTSIKGTIKRVGGSELG